MTEEKIKQIKIGIVIISALFLLISLTQNAFYIGSTNDPIAVDPMFAFLFGWMIILPSQISWLANPFLLFSWYFLFKNVKYSQYCSILAALFSLSFLLLKSVVTNEGGIPRGIVSYGIGYWLWLSSCVINCVGIYMQRITSNNGFLQ